MARTRAISAAMMAWPAMSPRTRTMRALAMRGLARLRELAFEILVERHAIGEQIVDARAGLARHAEHDVAIADARAGGERVARMCFCGVSPSAIAAAMPPCAQAEDAPAPSGAAATTVTGRGASFSAQNSPARPPPTMRMSELGMSADILMSPSLARREATRSSIACAAGWLRFARNDDRIKAARQRQRYPDRSSAAR